MLVTVRPAHRIAEEAFHVLSNDVKGGDDADSDADERADDAAADDEQAVVFAVVYAYGPAKHAADCRADGIADDAAHKHSDPSAATDRSEAPPDRPSLGADSEAHPLGRLTCE